VLAEGRFRLDAVLGSGAMGVVLRAYDASLGRPVALKALRQASAEHVYLLKHEFRGLAGISHPNLVELYELFTEQDSCFFTMELIEGRSFVKHFDEARRAGSWGPLQLATLRGCIAQLAAGLGALHAARQAHRDIKPSNVLVGPHDRVVLLDFGLAAPLRVERLRAPASGMYGTLFYVAPEQIFGEPASMAADCYSIGVTLFEVLTGRVPYDGPAAEIIAAKQTFPPPRPGQLASGIPVWLDEAVTRLLDPRPERRLGLAGLEERLDGASDATPRARPASLPDEGRALPPRPFVARAPELQVLRDAFAEVRAGAPAAVEVCGVSGIGKSELALRFLAELEEDGRAIALRGRCHPQESVPFKALDPIVDELSHALLGGSAAVSSLDAESARALLRLFPVLGRLPAIAQAADTAGPSPTLDPQQLRRQGILALREILVRLSAELPIVLWMDDVQWSDRDSAPVLREILRGPGAPRLLVVASYRPADALDSALVATLGDLAADDEIVRHRIDLGPLALDDAEQLARGLLERTAAPVDAGFARAVVEESEGSPFFVGELVRHLIHARSEDRARMARPPAIAEVTRARLDVLAPEARSLVELVAVAGGPIEAALVLDAAGLGAAGRPFLFRMCNQSLLREGEARGARPETLETYHDRVRETLLTALEPDGLRTRHRQLAEALSARPTADPEALLRHFLGAGDEASAAQHAQRAAEQAAAALAFERAAELYQTAVHLRGDRDDDWPLLAARAAALGAAGRGATAGGIYEDAARCAARQAIDAETVASLATSAAEQYLYAGLLQDGLRILRRVMHELDVPIPATPRAALRSAAGLRFRFFLRGSRAEPRASGLATRRELLRLDAMWKAARGTAMLDHTLGDVLALRHLLGALELGEPSRMVRALCMEAASEATVGGRWLRRRSQRLIESAGRLAQTTGEAYDEGVVLVHRAATALLAARFADCVAHAREAEAVFRQRCTGVAYELNIVHSFHCGALALLGRLKELDALTSTYLDEAQLRGDRYALAFFRSGDLVLLPLASGDADRALRQVDESLAGIPDDHFNSFHFYHLLGAVRVELYRGAGRDAWQRVAAAWPAVRAAGFLQLESLGTVLHYLYGCAALGAASSDPATPPSRQLVRAVERAERFLRRVTIPTGAPLGAVLRAGLHGLRRDRATQLETIGEAIAGCEAAGMALHREALRLQRAQLEGASDAETGRAAALGWMAAEGVCEPLAMARCIAPVPGAHA
jgi:hypothetical protein